LQPATIKSAKSWNDSNIYIIFVDRKAGPGIRTGRIPGICWAKLSVEQGKFPKRGVSNTYSIGARLFIKASPAG